MEEAWISVLVASRSKSNNPILGSVVVIDIISTTTFTMNPHEEKKNFFEGEKKKHVRSVWVSQSD